MSYHNSISYMISYYISLPIINSREPGHQRRKLATSKNLNCTSPLSKIGVHRIFLAVITIAGLFWLLVSIGIEWTIPRIMRTTFAKFTVYWHYHFPSINTLCLFISPWFPQLSSGLLPLLQERLKVGMAQDPISVYSTKGALQHSAPFCQMAPFPTGWANFLPP